MKKWLKALIVGIGAGIAGVLGRMGGATGYNTKYRDLGIPTCQTLCLIVLGINHSAWGFWWLVGAYFLAFGITFASLTTYWDWLFKKDNFWISGLATGLSVFLIAIVTQKYIGFGIRSILLSLIWGCLNKYLPHKILFWTRDIVEEFLRYFFVIATSLLLLI